MRNVFDQYDQPENKLTHALMATLANDRNLLRPFLRWLGVDDVPADRDVQLAEQGVPGAETVEEESESKGVPDGCIYTDDGWAVLLESKVQATVADNQIRHHARTARSHGYERPIIFVIAVDRPGRELPEQAKAIEWRRVYEWFSKRATRSFWAKELVEYMQVFESKMIAQDYGIRGTLTMFDGLAFGPDRPYTYREGKRLIRLLGDELQQREDLRRIGVDANGKRRTAITGRGLDPVWDFLPLKAARNAQQFTDYPHLTMGITPRHATASVTVPNGVKGGFRSKLAEVGLDGFRSLVSELERGLRPQLKRSKGAKPMMYVTQRHYRSQRSIGEVDARVDADLRTMRGSKAARVKCQPQWIDAIFELLTHKRSNLQLGVDLQFRYGCPVVGSPEAVDLFARTWIALKPLLDFVLSEA